MLRHFLPTIAVILLLSINAPCAVAQGEWIRIGSHIDWPDSLKEPQRTETNFRNQNSSRPDSAIESDSAIKFAGHIESIKPTGLEESLTLPECVYENRLAAAGWQIVPEGVMFPSYLAGEKEPRFASQWLWEKDRGRIWEAAVGGRWGLVRNGTYGAVNPEGFQFDIEGGALVRIDPEQEADLEAADFRVGFVATWKNGPWRKKVGYYHISSHVGDEYLLANPMFVRRNYVRDSLIAGVMYDVNQNIQLYGEFAAALNANGGAELGELQFGAQYSPQVATGFHGAPFAAINGHLRQEYNFGGSVNVEAGWQWRGTTDHLFRFGFQHYNGPSMQWSFVNSYESLTGLGIWYDF